LRARALRGNVHSENNTFLGSVYEFYPYFLRCPSDLDIMIHMYTCTYNDTHVHKNMPNDHEFRENWFSESQGRKKYMSLISTFIVKLD